MTDAVRTGLRWLARHPTPTALAGALTIAFSGILVRLSHAEPATAGFFRCLYALPLLAPFVLRERRRGAKRSRRHSLLGYAAGVFFAADLLAWHYSIRDIGAGLSTTLANAQVVVVAFVAWLLLHERLRPATLLALPVVGVGVVFISGLVEHGAYGANPRQGALLGVISAFAYAGYILLMRAATESANRPAAPLIEATLIGAIGCAIGGVALGRIDFVPDWPSSGWLVLLAATSQVLGWLLIGVSLPRLPAALGAILLTIQPVGSVALGRVIVNEHPSPLQLGGVGLLVCGVLLAAAGPQLAARRAREGVPVEL